MGLSRARAPEPSVQLLAPSPTADVLDDMRAHTHHLELQGGQQQVLKRPPGGVLSVWIGGTGQEGGVSGGCHPH
jgi:hypothetical protein